MIKPRLPRHAAVVTLALALSLVLVALSARDSSAAGTFNPVVNPPIFSTTAANTPAVVTTSFNLPAQDLNFGANVGFIPPEWDRATGLPIGTVVGTLDSEATLGLLGNPCDTTLQDVHFDLFNASINTADTISPKAPGATNRLEPLVIDDDGNGILDGAERYPDYLNTIFPGLTPRARLVGLIKLTAAGNLPVVLNFVQFNTGIEIPKSDLILDPPPPFDPRLGFPAVTVLQDPTEPAAPSAVTDFCAPLQATTVIFDNVNTNPAPRTYSFIAFTASQRDADGDGFENALDTCPFDTNQGNAKTNPDPGDAGEGFFPDGLDPVCDPDPNSACGPGAPDDFKAGDCDTDTFPNRGDNCPQVSNIGQEDADSDGIGDACEGVAVPGNLQGLGDPNTPNGEPIKRCIVHTVEIGGGGDPADTEFVNIPIGDVICNNVAVSVGPAPTATATPTGGGDDTTAPVITCPADITPVSATAIPDSQPAIAAFLADASASDAVDPSPTITNDAPSSFALEETTVTFTATDASDNSSSCTATVNVTPPERAEGTCKPGDTVTTDDEGDGATADDPVETIVTCPSADNLSIEETNISVAPPQGFQFFGLQVDISAFDSTPDDPWEIVFQLDSSIIPDGENENTTQVFKDGIQVLECSGASGTASPDPCVSDRALVDGDVEITVLTSTASSWNFGVPISGNGGDGGDGGGAGGGPGTGVGALAPAAASIPAWAAIASALGGAGLLGLTARAIARVLRRRP